MILRGDFHVHPLGHGPVPESLEHLNFHGHGAEPPARLWKAPSESEAITKTRAMMRACEKKGLDFYVNTDHVVNSSEVALRLKRDEGFRLTVIPGFEAAPLSADPSQDHVLAVGMPPIPGLAGTGMGLWTLARTVRRLGGATIAAHPLRDAFHLRGRTMKAFDAVEVCNCGAQGRYNRSGLPQVAVTDAHDPEGLLSRPCLTEVDAVENTAEAIIQALKAGNVRPVCG